MYDAALRRFEGLISVTGELTIVLGVLDYRSGSGELIGLITVGLALHIDIDADDWR